VNFHELFLSGMDKKSRYAQAAWAWAVAAVGINFGLYHGALRQS